MRHVDGHVRHLRGVGLGGRGRIGGGRFRDEANRQVATKTQIDRDIGMKTPVDFACQSTGGVADRIVKLVKLYGRQQMKAVTMQLPFAEGLSVRQLRGICFRCWHSSRSGPSDRCG